MVLGDIIRISSEINSVHPVRIGKAVETIVQVVYMDLGEKAGFNFIKEIKRHAGEEIITSLRVLGLI